MSKVTLKIGTTSNFTDIEKYLAGYDAAINVYDGDFTASWLLSDVYDEIWILKTNKTIKDINGKYKYVQTINWKRPLADGTLLTDKKNINFRKFIQQLVFIYRDSPIVSSATTNTTLMTMIPFCIWFYFMDV